MSVVFMCTHQTHSRHIPIEYVRQIHQLSVDWCSNIHAWKCLCTEETKNQIDLFKRYTILPRKLHIIMLLVLLVPFYYQVKNEMGSSFSIPSTSGPTWLIDPISHLQIVILVVLNFLLYGVQFYNLRARSFINIIFVWRR